uniref:Transcriptional regulator n=1 Tax=uncultured Candidatus Entotheonella sp. TaxID=312019 RepID=A0A1L7NR33_9BACT|nr:transcriptional regulator [uncultured Candidatus Entotheonella sp.]
MAEPIVAMAKELIMALIKENLLAPEDMQKELQKTHASLLELKASEEKRRNGEGCKIGDRNSRSGRLEKSIKKYTVECLVCGQTFKQLSVRHLRTYDLDPRSYRQQFGIPRTQALSAKETTAMRKRVVQESRPWEKAPTYMKAQEKKSTNGMAAKTKGTRKKTTAATSR